ncbi:hypothetical protein KCP78_23250 [Salmonella enterica subsp. enterica]|nr:hypothetical protein KCP78_23250 [Salmonella enterica subsp. enterica]
MNTKRSNAGRNVISAGGCLPEGGTITILYAAERRLTVFRRLRLYSKHK